MSLGKVDGPLNAAEAAAQQADPVKQAKEKAALQKACREFEGMFLAQMWKQMRKTVQKTELFSGGFGEEMFSDMLDQSYADAAAQRGALGMAELLEQQLSPQSYARPGGNLPGAEKKLENSKVNPYLKQSAPRRRPAR